MIQIVHATGVLKGRSRRALDSAVLDDAVATQDTPPQMIAAIRQVIREVPGADEAAAAQCTAHDYADPGKPKIAWNDEAARAEMVDALVGDALRLLGHLPDQELGEKAANAVGLLALVADQDVEPVGDVRDGRWRIARGTAAERIVSIVDPDSRHVHKTRSHYQDGYKAHVAIEPETGLFTAVTLTPGSGADHHEAVVGLDLLAAETTPMEVFGDTAYSSATTRGALQRAGHRLFIKPAPLQPAIPGGFTLDDFAIETTAATVTCPAGHTVALANPAGRHQQCKALFKDLCATCPLCGRCATAKAGRILTTRPPPPRPAGHRPAQAATTPPGRTPTAAGGHRSSAPSPG